MWHSRRVETPPFMANTILNFHFDYLTTPLTNTCKSLCHQCVDHRLEDRISKSSEEAAAPSIQGSLKTFDKCSVVESVLDLGENPDQLLFSLPLLLLLHSQAPADHHRDQT